MLKKALPLSIILAMSVALTGLANEKKVPQEKRPRFDAKAAIRGSGFRITTVHPMRGDFSEYDKIEIADMTSEVGDRASAEELTKFTEELARSLQQEGSFKEVIRVGKPQLAKRPAEADPAHGQASPATRAAPTEDAPLLADARMGFASLGFGSAAPPGGQSNSDPNSFGTSGHMSLPEPLRPQESKLIAVALAADAKRTMVIASELIYYKKGSRGLRALGLGSGSQRFVVRFHIYDKELGQELAMGNIAGEVNDGFGAVPFLAGNAEARTSVVDALANRVEVRRAKADQ